MGELTTLVDGRRVDARECLNLENALCGQNHQAELTQYHNDWGVICQCCNGELEHYWSPSGYAGDPQGGHYQCGPCVGQGIFKIQLP